MWPDSGLSWPYYPCGERAQRVSVISAETKQGRGPAQLRAIQLVASVAIYIWLKFLCIAGLEKAFAVPKTWHSPLVVGSFSFFVLLPLSMVSLVFRLRDHCLPRGWLAVIPLSFVCMGVIPLVEIRLPKGTMVLFGLM